MVYGFALRLKLQKPGCIHLKDDEFAFLKKSLAFLEVDILSVETKKLISPFLIIFTFLKMNVSTLFLAISKWLKLQKPNYTYCKNNLIKINMFSKNFLAILEAKLSLVEGVGINISKVAISAEEKGQLDKRKDKRKDKQKDTERLNRQEKDRVTSYPLL